METLEESNPLRQYYPETVYPNGTRIKECNTTRCSLWSLGSYFQSPFGRVKYWIIGPEIGKKVGHPSSKSDKVPMSDSVIHQVAFIHGISAPSIVFESIAPALAAKGARVLLYGI